MALFAVAQSKQSSTPKTLPPLCRRQRPAPHLDRTDSRDVLETLAKRAAPTERPGRAARDYFGWATVTSAGRNTRSAMTKPFCNTETTVFGS
jgi:hypothetical protein